MKAPPFLIVVVCFASIALADDFKTIDGKEYKKVKVSRVEPDGIVLRTKTGISKLYFTELPKEVQDRFHYDPAKAAAQAAQQNANVTTISPPRPDVAPSTVEPTATSGIGGLPPITVELKNEILSALRMTDKLDALYKRGCSSAEFIAAALPIEAVFMNSQNKLPIADPLYL